MLSVAQLIVGFASAVGFGPLIADICHWFVRRLGNNGIWKLFVRRNLATFIGGCAARQRMANGLSGLGGYNASSGDSNCVNIATPRAGRGSNYCTAGFNA